MRRRLIAVLIAVGALGSAIGGTVLTVSATAAPTVAGMHYYEAPLMHYYE